jgi:outer membrane protein assembly factor BamB
MSRKISRAGAGLLAAVTVAGAAACGSSSPPPVTTSFHGAATPSGSWPYPNGDLANTRDAAGSAISSANVASLREAWSFKLAGQAAAGVGSVGALVAAPVVVNGVVYIQDLDCNVYALSLATGALKWEYQVNTPEKTGPGPNGVAVANGTVYGDTPSTVFALNAATGKTDWVDGSLLTSGQGTFEIQPQVSDGRVYISSAYGIGPGGGVAMALNAATGKRLWSFDTVRGADTGVQSIGLGSGGAWETPLVGGDGSVTFGTGNPYQSAASAMAHPSVQLYTDSDVNLDAATGKLRWYYQGVPNDFKDWDMQTSPISASVGGAPAVIGSGKMGIVYAMNASTGALLWKTPVGEHNGTDNDSLLMLEHKITIKAPYTILPGSIGGVLANMAVADGTVYAGTIDLPLTYTNLNLPVAVKSAGAPAGEVEALSLATGKVEWDTKVPTMPLGAATVSGDLVFTTLYNGVLLALNRRTGAIVYRRSLPASTNAPIAIAGNSVIVPAGAPQTSAAKNTEQPQLVAYTVRLPGRVGHGVDHGGGGEDEDVVLAGEHLDAVGVADPEPPLGDLGDLMPVTFDRVLVVDDVPLDLHVRAVVDLDLPALAERRDHGLLDQRGTAAVRPLDLHAVADVQHAFLDLVQLAPVHVLEPDGLADPQGLAV